MATMLGSLLVSLGMESASFTKGMTNAQRQMKRTQQGFDKIGTKMAGLGKTISVGFTAPVIAAAAAFGKSAHDMAMQAREMSTAAQVAGEGFEDFQRQTYAAKSVGVEFDKLGDIFKDVRDRVGDFAATGGGPMADFFENIGPKVGVTAEAFKNLSGKESLQLYYDSLKAANVSQDEMVFYLEAMASDTTALIPLLEKGGKAFRDLGENASVIDADEAERLEKYVKAQERLGEATKALTIAFVSSGLLDTVVSLVERFAAFTEKLSQTNPLLLEVGAIVAGVAAVVGPFIIILGNLVSAWGVLLPVLEPVPALFGSIRMAALALMANPVFLAFAGVIAAITAAWYYWDDIKPILVSLGEAVSAWYSTHIKPTFDAVMAVIEPFISFFADYFAGQFRDAVRLISSLVSGDFAGAWDAAKSIVGRAVEALRNFVPMMIEVGGDLIAGLVRGILDNATSVFNAIANVVTGAIGRANELLEINSPSRVFMGIGNSVAEGFAKGIIAGKPMVDGAIGEMAQGTEVQAVRIADSLQDMVNKTVDAFRGMSDAIKGGGFLDILGSAVNLFMQLGSTGLFGKTIAGNINKTPSIPGYANGTNFAPGGLALVGELGPELVNLPRGSQVTTNRELRSMAGGGGGELSIRLGSGLEAEWLRKSGMQTVQIVEATAPQIAGASSARARRDASRPIMPGGVTG